MHSLGRMPASRCGMLAYNPANDCTHNTTPQNNAVLSSISESKRHNSSVAGRPKAVVLGCERVSLVMAAPRLLQIPEGAVDVMCEGRWGGLFRGLLPEGTCVDPCTVKPCPFCLTPALGCAHLPCHACSSSLPRSATFLR